jgi:hypothetical protein
MFHTTTPVELIIGEKKETPSIAYYKIEGKTVSVINGKIERLFSTDPNDFLNPMFSPNNKVKT